jgi:hypothetical protein
MHSRAKGHFGDDAAPSWTKNQVKEPEPEMLFSFLVLFVLMQQQQLMSLILMPCLMIPLLVTSYN